MWGGSRGGQAPGMPGGYGGAPYQHQQHQQMHQQPQQKNDIFVGNLAFNTTEEQLHQVFSDIGRVINVRLVTDMETGKPRGFAFVEFEDPQAALTAIRNMNGYDLNGRGIRVNFSSSSHLEALAGKLGMDLSQNTQRSNNQKSSSKSTGSGTNAVADALKAFSKSEMYDVVAQFKEIADRNPDEARRLLSGHPQLPEAMLFLMSKLDMMKNSASSDAGPGMMSGAGMGMMGMGGAGGGIPAAPPRAADPRSRGAGAAPRSDPRAVAAPPAPPPPRADPRAARMDPRAAARSVPPPPPPPPVRSAPLSQQYGGVPQQPPGPPGVTNLDPALVQQVMLLTPQQISQLPPDKQQSIMALRQQISGNRM